MGGVAHLEGERAIKRASKSLLARRDTADRKQGVDPTSPPKQFTKSVAELPTASTPSPHRARVSQSRSMPTAAHGGENLQAYS